MLKYFCLVVLIMSSFGWTREPIEFQNVFWYDKKHRIKMVNYYVVNNENQIELRRSVKFNYEYQTVDSDYSYLNGQLHGKYYDYRNGESTWIGNYLNGEKDGKWYSKSYTSDDSIFVTTYKNGNKISHKKMYSKRGLTPFH